MLFVVGQRWVSHTEPQLGLGIVVETESRRVTMSFPAVGEQRAYATDNAPLGRILYKVGDRIENQDEQSFTVVAVQEHRGLMLYKGIDAEGGEYILDELSLNCFVQFSSPEQRLFSGQFDKSTDFELRIETLMRLNHLQQSPVRGLLGSRTNLLPHQIYIASQVAQRHAPRVLLADEVGLGKTIEAGMILHYQLHTGRAGRVLIGVPESLLHQWLVEMLRRFNLHFSIFDEDRYQVLEESGEGNPFEAEQLVLCSVDFLLGNANAHASACAAQWDLLVVDEAHHLHWSEVEVSPAYQCIEQLAARCEGLLLLTATPEQVGVDSHFARLRLLDPARFHCLSAFKREAAQYVTVNKMVEQLLASDKPDAHLLAELHPCLGNDAETAKLSREEIIRQLLDRHGTGRVLFRNTRAAVQGFPQRKVYAYPLECPAIYMSLMATDTDNVSALLSPELSVDEIQWIKLDPRVVWLTNLLKTLRPAKVLVICAHAQTAIALEHYLHLRVGIRSAAFHEGLSIIERDRAGAYFADSEEGAQTLICSEIGSEGRNFQFAQHLVLFDLPLNPDVLEQRIGRLDRIGQQEDIHIHVPYLAVTAQEVLYRWYHEGLSLFERSCSVGYAIYIQFATRVHRQLRQMDSDLEILIQETAHATAQMLGVMQAGRDRLLELNSCDSVQAQTLIEIIQAEERSIELQEYMAQVFDVYGVEHEIHSEQAQVLHPSDHMRSADFPGLKEEGITVVFDRQRALQREDMMFLSWEHPMVTECMEMILHSELGNAALATIKTPEVAPGTLLLETVYTINCIAPKSLQLERFLPLSPIRILLDADGNHYSEHLSHAKINSLRENIQRSTALAVIKKIRGEVDALLVQSERSANAVLPERLGYAKAKMEADLTAEIERLKALKKINPSIRESELVFHERKHVLGVEAIDRAALRLQAMRVVIAV